MLKNTPIGYLVREIRPQEVSELKVGNSRECPGSVPERPPTTPRGGSCRGLQKHIYGGPSLSDGEKQLLVSLELASNLLTRITNHKLDWVLGASMNVRAWIMSCLAPG